MIVSTTVLLVAASVSNIISKFNSRIADSYIALAIGIIIAYIPILNAWVAPFHTEVFMIGVVAPLLYIEGQTTSLSSVKSELGSIIGVTVTLAVVTAIMTGFVVNLATTAAISLPIAFLMASIATPTDATASESVRVGLEMPQGVEKMLKMESLFNDATGIVLLNGTLLWATAGQLNVGGSINEFIIAAVGGAFLGIVAAITLISFRQGLSRTNMDSTSAQNLIFIMTPFIVYFLAEELHVSGVIAVVCAGLLQNNEGQRSRFVNPRQFHNGLQLADLMREILNDMVFVILGIMLVRIFREDFGYHLDTHHPFFWIVAGVVMYVMGLLARYLYMRFMRRSRRDSLLFSLGGVHGAVTLALVFMVHADDIGRSAFSMLVLSESVLVLLSMIVPTVAFKFLLPHGLSQREELVESDRIRQAMVAKAIKAVESMYLPPKVKVSVLYDLRDQVNLNTLKDFWKVWLISARYPELTPEETELQMRALRYAFVVERDYLDEISQMEHMENYVYKIYNDVLLSESILLNSTGKLDD